MIMESQIKLFWLETVRLHLQMESILLSTYRKHDVNRAL